LILRGLRAASSGRADGGGWLVVARLPCCP
jgi:hypothetical protein